MIKINNSNELIELIKEVAENQKNWSHNGTHLKIRFGFGARVVHDVISTSDDFNPTGDLDVDELILSQVPKYDAREKFIGPEQSNKLKDCSRQFDDFLYRLYNEEQSPLYHGFLDSMQNLLKDSLLLNRREQWCIEMIDSPIFSSENVLRKFLDLTICSATSDFEGLIPKKEYFPPIGWNSRDPPSITQWKKTKNGRDFIEKSRTATSNYPIETSSRSNSSGIIDLSAEQVERSSPVGYNRTSSAWIGMIEIHTGISDTKLRFSDQPGTEKCTLGTNTTLFELMKNAKNWEKYDAEKEERYYDVMKSDGSIFTTYIKDELRNDSIHHLITMMSLQKGEILKFKCGVRVKKIVDIESYDNEMSD